MNDSHAHLVPRAGLDPIADAATALEVVQLAVHLPPRHETIVVLLDDTNCGSTIAVVADTVRPDDVLEVAECLVGAAAGADHVAGILLASVRPGSRVLDPTDVERWIELNEICAAHGIELLEWFVLGDEVHCPRDALCEPQRWER